ncbi:DUF6894 family protein [Novosphingobium sp. JCM 18896]|uniref:DUF6894 family protein n=1 Tax=Novosphingobium sp. JCM 18896 TaxID=2989731 RepID=UPI002221DAE7|nr:hypothetical protein [Novosphingobium sp. JCM 18896]MCW1429794.1 hypothetical protein [Novosphingobium sp. JCM 18896]
MPRFFFHVHNGDGETRDDEGLDLPDQANARDVAIDSIRSIIAEEARQGMIDLQGRIDITEGEDALLQVAFIEAFDLRLPEGDGA